MGLFCFYWHDKEIIAERRAERQVPFVNGAHAGCELEPERERKK